MKTSDKSKKGRRVAQNLIPLNIYGLFLFFCGESKYFDKAI